MAVHRDQASAVERPTAVDRHLDGWDSPFAAGRATRWQRPVRVFELDPGLLDGVEPHLARIARQRVVAESVVLATGPWTPPQRDELGRDAVGLLVLDGLLMRSLAFDGLLSPELFGVGDVLRPWESDELLDFEVTAEWRVLERATVALLDAEFARQVCRIPGVTAALLARAIQRSRSLAFRIAVAHIRRAEPRVLTLFWHLGDRWGTVTPRGVAVPLRLSHSMIASLVYMRRSTVSAVLTRLARAGELERNADGSWLITGERPALTGITRRTPPPRAA